MYRLYENDTNKAIADVIAGYDEVIDNSEDLTIYHQSNLWKFKTLEKETFRVEPLHTLIFDEGKRVYDLPTIDEIRQYSKSMQDLLWDEIYRLEFPHIYYVDLTKKLLETKMHLLEEKRKS